MSRESLKDILCDIEEVEYDLILMGEVIIFALIYFEKISEFLYNIIKLDRDSIFSKP
jgi:hypothetical protein